MNASTFKQATVPEVLALARELFASSRAFNVGVDVYERKTTAGRLVTAVAFASTNASSSSRVPGVVAKVFVEVPMLDPGVTTGARALATQEAIDGLDAKVRGEIARRPPRERAPRAPTKLELEAAIVAANMRGDGTAVAALETQLLEARARTAPGAVRTAFGRSTPRAGELIEDSRLAEEAADALNPPRAKGGRR